MNVTIGLNCGKKTCGYASNQRCQFLRYSVGIWDCKLFNEENLEIAEDSTNNFCVRSDACLESDSYKVFKRNLRGREGIMFN